MHVVSNDEVFEIIKATGVNLDWDKIKPDVSLIDQGADSLDMITMLFGLQEKFNFEIPEDSIAKGDWLTIQKMVNQLNERLSARKQ